jgi:Flp pilus assembly protein TadD
MRDYSESRIASMKSAVLVALLLLSSALPAFAQKNRSEAEKQVKFGITVAQYSLWREAITRFERAADIDPTYAAAYNNLAIAYEHQGDLESARKAYEKALKLEPNNQYIKQNYELFREINDRANRQGSR